MTPSQGSSPLSPADEGDSHGRVDIRSARRLELQLFYQYVTETGPTLASDEVSRPFFGPVAIRMAFQSDAVLYSICLMSAIHQAKLGGFADADLMKHCSTYLNMALKEHQTEVAHLTADNVDSACMTSSLLRVYGFVRLQDRPLTPYTPPLEWLRMTSSSNVTFRQAYALSGANTDSIGLKMMSTVAYILDERQKDQNSRGLTHLLRRQEPHELVEAWDDDTVEAYKMALNCIGLAWKAITEDESFGTLCRRLVVFPMMVDKRFLGFVEERRPRALVIMAHYFALLANMSNFWWIGDTGRREVAAIEAELPADWQDSLRLALAILSGVPVAMGSH